MTMSNVAAPFVYKNRFNDRISEYNIEYTPGVNSAEKLAYFLQECKDEGKMVNIEVKNGLDVDALWPFMHFDNMRIRITSTDDMTRAEHLREKHIKFFFDERFRACNWKQLRDQISYGCCQIYVADDLTHCLKKVYNICQKNEVGMRLVLNHVHSTGPYCGLNETDWFMRPEDMDYLGEYFDVFEFDCSYMSKNGEYEWSKFDALYRTYFEKKRYIGNLQEIVYQLGFVLPNASVAASYAHRTECGFHCASGSSCQMCLHHRELAEQLDGKGVMIIEGKR